jgi:predicted restriction endonuclease
MRVSICPEEMFLWLEEPVPISACPVTKATQFLRMFSGHTEISSEQSMALIEQLPDKMKGEKWRRIASAISPTYADSLLADIQEVEKAKKTKKTIRARLVEARIGQGQFRKDLEQRWDNACELTGLQLRELLRASHIKPWPQSTNPERLDGNNGLLLAAHVDALFDRGLISFSDVGKLLYAKRFPNSEKKSLGSPTSLSSKLNKTEAKYLAYHQKMFGF